MDIREQIQRVKELKEYINTELPKFAEQVAVLDLAALVANRVVQKGKDYLGNDFTAYSTIQIPAWKFYGKSRTQTAEKKIRGLISNKGDKGKGGVLSYEEFRILNNLKTDKKNYEFTGEMWRKFGIVSSRTASGGIFKISLGGTTTAAQNKIDENSKEAGLSIIEASEAEKALVNNSVSDWIDEQADRILNG